MNLVLRNPTENALGVFALKREYLEHGVRPILVSPTIPIGGQLSISAAEAALFGTSINHPLVINDLDAAGIGACICTQCVDAPEVGFNLEAAAAAQADRFLGAKTA